MKQSSRSFWGRFLILLSFVGFLGFLAVPEIYTGPAALADEAHQTFLNWKLL